MEEEFSWGSFSKEQQNIINKEIFIDNTYERFFEVEEGDIVLDVGASVGPFTYSILNKKPKHVYCLEPSVDLFPSLIKNVKNNFVTCINKGITSHNGFFKFGNLYSEGKYSSIESQSITFDTFLKEYDIKKIDFLKSDCEGGEYDIFNDENFDWIVLNVKKISAEFHLTSEELKGKFRKFRDTYLKHFTNYQIRATDQKGNDIDPSWDVWHNDKIYGMMMIYINNK